ncbi:MAG: thiamine pyrophosphate-binding protein [Proteiniphilum sp.]|uniref:thiamine pyrophosphate-binding protein n=1 Tax=Proteiniphilum sp. TaxID=1926877 RepID=UPI002ABAE088|nr:thiamine pyrophosphate-binding protein [Proteiniphilum sp.]MDY9918630.1 thiamine pyrophosphate-binding protein [Proteiniphilum sp.]
MEKYYTNEINVQIVISLLKAHGIRKIVASPGTTNMTFVASVQQDPFFQMYSSVDERSAAYIACGLAAESKEPVVLSCTGATASRNYFPGLTEAYYRKLPILALTALQSPSKVGHHIAQVIDRSNPPKDAVKYSVTLPIVKDNDDLWDCEIKVNKAILELKRHGGGPVHINLPTTYSRDYSVKELPQYRVIQRITPFDGFPEIPAHSKIGIFIGSHLVCSEGLTKSIEEFCNSHDAVVFCDHTSNYHGKNSILFSLAGGQHYFDNEPLKPDILIHIGEITGDYYTTRIGSNEVWRVNEDGEIRDTFKKLGYVFEMPEQFFFEKYLNKTISSDNSYFAACQSYLNGIKNRIPELPFSNIWMASKMAQRIPDGSIIHFGILNSLRSWNFFELPDSVTAFSNVGGFGIDGDVSSMIGASLANKNKLYFGVVGDLAFFYDMNVIGNRHVGNNIRILLINNGKGTEFRQYNHVASQFEDDADEFIAAAGHFGNQSRELVKNYAQNLGFEYFAADNKKDFESAYERFLTPEITEKPMLFEVFTNDFDESKALEMILSIEESLKGKTKELAKQMLGQKGIKTLKKIMGK